MSSGFVTETELAEARKKRQEEWEKVRQPDEPLGKTQSISSDRLFLHLNVCHFEWF